MCCERCRGVRFNPPQGAVENRVDIEASQAPGKQDAVDVRMPGVNAPRERAAGGVMSGTNRIRGRAEPEAPVIAQIQPSQNGAPRSDHREREISEFRQVNGSIADTFCETVPDYDLNEGRREVRRGIQHAVRICAPSKPRIARPHAFRGEPMPRGENPHGRRKRRVQQDIFDALARIGDGHAGVDP